MGSEERPAKRRALGTLDPNRDLTTRTLTTKRAPIIFDRENEDAVLHGIATGIYDADEVMAYTNQQRSHLEATPAQPADADSEDEPLASRSGPGSYGPLEERPVEDFQVEQFDDEMLDQDLDDDLDEDIPEDHVEGAEGDEADAEVEDEAAYFDPTSMGLKEINNLAHFGVSSHKPGNGVEELLSDDLDKYWQ